MEGRARRVWIGLADVRPEPGNDIFDGAPGAYSNVLCLARDEAEYRALVRSEFGRLGLVVEGFEDVEPLQRRRSRPGAGGDVTGEILALARRLSDSSPVLYDTFYVYKSE